MNPIGINIETTLADVGRAYARYLRTVAQKNAISDMCYDRELRTYSLVTKWEKRINDAWDHYCQVQKKFLDCGWDDAILNTLERKIERHSERVSEAKPRRRSRW